MSLRKSGAGQVLMVLLLAAIALPFAALAEGPRYTYIGAAYQWTDAKYAVDPSDDPDFNNGDFEGINLDASLGIFPFLFVAGEYFTGDCNACATDGNDLDFDGYKVGIGWNQSLDLIGLDPDTDFILRGNFVDVDLENVDTDDGWSIQAEIRSQISERSEIQVGYEYYDVGDLKNRDLTVGIIYEVWAGLALTARGVIFDDDTGFDLGFRWYFGELVFSDRDSVIR